MQLADRSSFLMQHFRSGRAVQGAATMAYAQAALLLTGFCIGWLGQHISFRLAILPNFAPIWIPGGVLMGLLLLLSARYWIALCTGTVAGGILTLIQYATPPAYAVVYYAAVVPAIVLGRVCLGKTEDPVFQDVWTFFRYLLVIVMLLAMAIGFYAAIIAFLAGMRPNLFPSWISTAPSAAMGFLLISPWLFAVGRHHSPTLRWNWRLALEALLLSVGLLALSMGLWILVPPSPNAMLFLLLLAPTPLLLVIALRFGIRGSTTSFAIVLIPLAWFSTYVHQAGPGRQLNIHIMQLWVLGVGSLIHVLALQTKREHASQEELRTSRDHIRDLATRLLETQEEESSRIARELHDAVNQQIALLGIRLSSLRSMEPEDQRLQIGDMQVLVTNLAEDVRRISHNLHPVVLDHVGLVAALRSLVAEVSVRWEGKINLDSERLDPPPDYNVSLCIYRVAQEAISNAVKHSGARNLRLRLYMEERTYVFLIQDDGNGFDIAKVKRTGGLGLLSMKERTCLVRGQVTIHSKPELGTSIWVRIPTL